MLDAIYLMAKFAKSSFLLQLTLNWLGGVQFDPPLWFFGKCTFHREGKTLVFCDFQYYHKSHLC